MRGLIGVSGQYAAVDEYLSGRENLQMVGELYQMKPKDAKYAPGNCSNGSSSSTQPTGGPRPTPEACADGSTWQPRWWYVLR